MDYAQTLQWLFTQLPMYQRIGAAAYKANLDNTLLLDAHLNHPHRSFRSLHIAGTNGKGSVSSMLASVLQEAGYKTGLYTSPHLKDFRERIKINGHCIPETDVVNFVSEHQKFLEKQACSFFEMTVGLAFDYFRRENIDVAVVEVGMGGRLDSTNIIQPELAVITNIGLDHTQFLGDTLAKIAVEKAGIIKPKTPVVIGEYHPETYPVFEKTAAEKQAPLKLAEKVSVNDYTTDLKGNYQAKNLKTTLAAVEVLRKDNRFEISETALRQGLQRVVENTGLLGRWQLLQTQPKVIADTAHNLDGLTYTMAQLQTESYARLHMVLGFVEDKNLENLLPLFPKNAIYYFCKPNLPRGRDAMSVCGVFEQNGFTGQAYTSVDEAYMQALSNAQKADLIYIGGSNFVVAEVL
ncbi:MAG: bifunctional folylpolyglutamate synthase/dihydrofolate synthase [Bacteroidetes bacterium]|nr:bifunctional folylpolyglutamate synthase/dihydrofolate synthase [Bacteroidota bacterium]